ncbi:MAG TPA: cation-translocating P-type ATPase C-terminal domain-containing protein, partial [Anaerolineales bacterium]|nr:cation-translocating P-type ATPase C-terminal domain-containing protein [Anaerolineales bacterium]
TWAIKPGRSIQDAMTLTFISLILIQFFKAYNYRSEQHSVLNHPFVNKWLNAAILWDLVLLILVVYMPVLQRPFGTFSLTLIDWLIVIGLSLTITPILELAKWIQKRNHRSFVLMKQ